MIEFQMEETYNWRDDIMEITLRIVHETDEARSGNKYTSSKAEYTAFQRKMEKQKQQRKPKTNADRIRAMTDEELADYLRWHDDLYSRYGMDWLDWLKQEAKYD